LKNVCSPLTLQQKNSGDMSRFLDPVVLAMTEKVERGRVVRRVARSFRFEIGRKYNSFVIVVPAGMETDLATIPRFFHRIFSPDGPWAKASVLHDFLYRTQLVTRCLADAMFFEAMESLEVRAWQKWTIYLAVRCFGRRAYRPRGGMLPFGPV